MTRWLRRAHGVASKEPARPCCLEKQLAARGAAVAESFGLRSGRYRRSCMLGSPSSMKLWRTLSLTALVLAVISAWPTDTPVELKRTV
jgi:hypothetical protein